MFAFTISIILIAFAVDIALTILNYRNRHAPVPKNVDDVYNENDYKKWLQYSMEITKVSMIQKITGRTIIIVFLIMGVFPLIAEYTSRLTQNTIFQSLLFLALYGMIEYIVSIGFQVYRTFSIEQRYGFNTSSLKTFVLDQVKTALMSAVLGGSILYIVLHLYSRLGNQSIIYSWGLIVMVSLAINILYTRVFVKIFNKLTPLTQGPLYDKTKELARSTGYEIEKISIMDASKRSTKLNAYFSGFGNFKQIILYDTLVEKCSNNEIISILAHEIGHFKNKDIIRNFAVMIVQSACFLYVLSFFLSSDQFATAFGFTSAHYGFSIILFNILMEPIGILLNIPMSYFSRKAEYRADAFAAKTTDATDMVSALKVLARENYSNLTPHPLVVKMTYSHPPISERIKAILGSESV
ncbi:M48 family metallopeptidase [Fusibacter sp. JL216-2]|uniref:M48 family metallopeptidase n=1 Tax=Fusibacter sp. JL216-2 TaxID=3071453 RepID=UPI003D34EBF8